MFGNIINNRQIENLIKEKEITISPFRKNKLKLAHYGLGAAGIMWAGQLNSKGKREFISRHDFSSSNDYTFEAGEYAIVEIEEFILLPDGVVGHFLPSSSLIERGFWTNCWKVGSEIWRIGRETAKDIVWYEES